jgi:hypothetical protein
MIDRVRRLGPWRLGVLAALFAAVVAVAAVLILDRGSDGHRVTTSSGTSSSSSSSSSSSLSPSSSAAPSSEAPASSSPEPSSPAPPESSTEETASSAVVADDVPAGLFVRVTRAGALVVSHFDGSDERVLLDRASEFAWSPDRARLAVVDGDSLELVDPVTGTRTPIATGSPHRVAWSHDGQSLLYLDGANGVLRVVPSAGGDAHQVAVDAELADWSPDDTTIAYTLRDGVVDADGDAPAHLVRRDGSDDHALKDPNDGGPTKATIPSFSPDGSRLLLQRRSLSGGGDVAVVVSTDGVSWRTFPNFIVDYPLSSWVDDNSVLLIEIGYFRLDLVTLDGGDPRPATDGVIAGAALSDDRANVAWVTQDGAVRVRDLRSGAVVELRPANSGPPGMLIFSPDATALAFRGSGDVWTVARIDGTNQWTFSD